MKYVAIAISAVAIVVILWTAVLYSVAAFVALDWWWVLSTDEVGRALFFGCWVGGLFLILIGVASAYDAVLS